MLRDFGFTKKLFLNSLNYLVYWKVSAKCLSEKYTESIANLSHLVKPYRKLACVETLDVACGNKHISHPELFGLSDTLLNAGHRTDFARQTNLACHTPVPGNSHIDIARKDSGNNTQVERRVIHLKTARNIQKHIFGAKLEAHSFLEHRQ